MALTKIDDRGLKTPIDLLDNEKIRLGTGNDLELYHDGSHSYIKDAGTGRLILTSSQFDILNAADNEFMARFIEDGATELYHNGSKKLETYSAGVEFHGNLKNETDGVNEGIYLGASNDLGLYHDGSNSHIKNNTNALILRSDALRCNNNGNTETMIKADADGAVELYYDNSKMFETYNGGVWIPDGTFYASGADKDVAIGHNTTNYITYKNADLLITGDASNQVKIMPKSDEAAAVFKPNDCVELYYNNSKKLDTISGGVRVSGVLKAYESESDALYTQDSWHILQSSRENDVVLILDHSGNSAPYGVYMTFSDAAPDNNVHYFLYFADSSTGRFRVYSDGDVDNHDNSYGSMSDVKLKENIVDAKSQWDDIKAVRVRNFNFKSDTPSDKRLGVIAQEIESISPSLVTEHPDLDKEGKDLGTTTKSVKYSILYMKAIKCLQEAMAKIETLEAKVAALEAA